MAKLTEAAAKKIMQFIEQEEQNGRANLAIRLDVRSGGCSGLRYALYLDDAIGDQDVVEEFFGVRLVISKISFPYVRNVIIDYVDTLEESGFKIFNPDAKGVCGCGQSFH